MPGKHKDKAMGKIWYLAAALCLIYCICITAYTGNVPDSGWLWPVGAALLAGTGWVWSACRRGTLPGYWRILTSVGWLCAVLILAVLLGLIASHMRDDTQEDLEYVIVLGAQVKETVPSRALKRRLDKALSYAQSHPAAKLILSGGQGSGENISEAQCMVDDLTARGIEPERLILEDASTSTWENLVFSDRKTGCAKVPCGIISNNFHIWRALSIARSLGYEKPVGLAARSEAIMQPHYILRETAAIALVLVRRMAG